MAHIQFENDVDPVAFFYAMKFVGEPYKWGGDSMVDGGFDCSGLVLEILRSSGQWPHKNDINSQGIYNHFVQPDNGMSALYNKFGSLLFYGKSVSDIRHVAFGLDHARIIDAGGGSSRTRTLEDARRDDAFVRVRIFNYRKDLQAIIHPHAPSWL